MEELSQRDGWRITPDREGTWLYIDHFKRAWIARVYSKNGTVYAVKNGYRCRARYGMWFPLGPVPGVGSIVLDEGSK